MARRHALGAALEGPRLLARRLSRRGPAPAIVPLEGMFARDVASVRVPSSVLSSTIRAVTPGAATRASAAGLISPGVAALSEGVIKAMMLTKLKSVAIAAALALGLCGIAGAVVFVGQDNKGPAPTAPATAIARDENKGAAGQPGSSGAASARPPCSGIGMPWPARAMRPPASCSSRRSGRGTC